MSTLPLRIAFKPLRSVDQHYMALGMNYSTAGFELILSRKMSFYIITYYLPSGLFVGISWVRWDCWSLQTVTPILRQQ